MPIKKLGILAGGGALPRKLVSYCHQHDINYHVIGFEGQDLEGLSQEAASFQWASLSTLGMVVAGLKKEGVSHVVLIGSIQRPSFASLVPDIYTLKLLTKLGRKLLGDDSLLRFLVAQLEKEGFTVVGIQDIYREHHVLLPEGSLSKDVPKESLIKELPKIMAVALQFASTDIGQSLVFCNEVVLGAEGLEGTDGLLKRCADLRAERLGLQSGGMLVKVCKPHQDKRVDLPTIGPQTIQLLSQLGYLGVIAQAGRVLVVDLDACIKKADDHGLFIMGVKV